MSIAMRRYLAELIGTAVLVLVGCGAVAIGGYGASLPLGVVPIGLAFGLAVMAMAYAIGPVSGCHINPARSLGPAVFVGGQALLQVWLFLIMPLVGGAVAGWLFRARILSALPWEP